MGGTLNTWRLLIPDRSRPDSGRTPACHNRVTRSRLLCQEVSTWVVLPVSVSRELHTARLILRRWRPSDRDLFAALNADARVMEHLPARLSRDESDAFAERIEQHFDHHGFGLWAVEIPDVAALAGFVGLSVPPFVARFTPCVEVGWRLAAAHWGCGYATEGARATLTYGFKEVGLDEIVSFTVPGNVRSRRVMEKLGMVHWPADDFDHPTAPERLRRHVLYRIGRQALPSSECGDTRAGAGEPASRP